MKRYTASSLFKKSNFYHFRSFLPEFQFASKENVLKLSRMRFPLVAHTLLMAHGLLAGDPLAPTTKEGRPLNLGFESGDLRDWTATGTAFNGQPIMRGSVAAQRPEMKSQPTGNSWIGGFEKLGDDAKGTLTSAPFLVNQPWASFLVGGGPWPETRVELIDTATSKVFFKISGTETEALRPVVVELKGLVGKEIQVRLVDERTGHWGHINFDDFRLHTVRPIFTNEVVAVDQRKSGSPPADTVLHAGLNPSQVAASVTLPPDFSLQVFAAEPDVRNPIAFCEDHRGRLWVAEGLTYPKRVGKSPVGASSADQLKDIFGGKDRILIFEDTDGDGKADKRTVFLEGLNLVSGLEYGFGGLWIGAAPYLMFIPVIDGATPKPGGDPRILLDGWNFTADSHETLNTFTWGPDGWLYGCHGVFCPSHVGKPGAAEAQRQWMDAGVWRYHPVTHSFEVFTEGGSNPWGIDFDEQGNLWAEMCVIPHLFHMIQGARITRQGGEHFTYNASETLRNAQHRESGSRKPVFPFVYESIGTHADHVHWTGGAGPHAANGRSDASGGGHAHAGMLCYLGDSWPSDYRGRLLIGNIHGQRINTDIPTAKGSGYLGQHGPDFLNFNDSWSQTLNQRLDPDGNLFIIDWYDANQCHHGRDDGHDHSSGRIYKVVYKGVPVTHPDLTQLDNAELVRRVTSRNEWMSRHSRRLLQERMAQARALEDVSHIPAGLQEISRTVQAGRKMEALSTLINFADTTGPTPARLRALWTLHITGRLTPEEAGRWVTDPEPQIRAWTLQLFFENSSLLFQQPELESLADGSIESLTRLAAEDPSPVVRRAVASVLHRLPIERRWEIAKALLTHAEDASDHNLPLLYWYGIEGAVASNPTRAESLLKGCRLPKVREFITRRLTQLALTQP